MLGHIDLHVEVTPVNVNKLTSAFEAEKSEKIRERIIKARALQDDRFVVINAHISPNKVRNICKINESGQVLVKQAMEKLGSSARAYDHILNENYC